MATGERDWDAMLCALSALTAFFIHLIRNAGKHWPHQYLVNAPLRRSTSRSLAGMDRNSGRTTFGSLTRASHCRCATAIIVAFVREVRREDSCFVTLSFSRDQTFSEQHG